MEYRVGSTTEYVAQMVAHPMVRESVVVGCIMRPNAFLQTMRTIQKVTDVFAMVATIVFQTTGDV